MSDNCSNPTSFVCILRQIEYGVFSRPLISAPIPLSAKTSFSSIITFSTRSSPRSRKNSNRRVIDLRAFGFNSAKAKSSSSAFSSCIPIRSANGAKISMVSVAMRWRFSGFAMKFRVRMLCKRSANLTSNTRMSWDIASTSFRKFSACFA